MYNALLSHSSGSVFSVFYLFNFYSKGGLILVWEFLQCFSTVYQVQCAVWNVFDAYVINLSRLITIRYHYICLKIHNIIWKNDINTKTKLKTRARS